MNTRLSQTFYLAPLFCLSGAISLPQEPLSLRMEANSVPRQNPQVVIIHAGEKDAEGAATRRHAIQSNWPRLRYLSGSTSFNRRLPIGAWRLRSWVRWD